jgi:hypothetical protein
MNAELNHHLGYQKHAPEGRGTGNSRNGRSRKKVQGDFGSVEIEVPRDRNGTYDPKIIPKHERRFTGFDQKILSMYARGMTTRDIQSHLEEIYGVEVSPSLISEVTDAVMEEVRAWQSRLGRTRGMRTRHSRPSGLAGELGFLEAWCLLKPAWRARLSHPIRTPTRRAATSISDISLHRDQTSRGPRRLSDFLHFF